MGAGLREISHVTRDPRDRAFQQGDLRSYYFPYALREHGVPYLVVLPPDIEAEISEVLAIGAGCDVAGGLLSLQWTDKRQNFVFVRMYGLYEFPVYWPRIQNIIITPLGATSGIDGWIVYRAKVPGSGQ